MIVMAEPPTLVHPGVVLVWTIFVVLVFLMWCAAEFGKKTK